MADIKLKDIGGEEKTYSGIKHIKVPSSTGEPVEFDLEATVQEKSVEVTQNGTTEVTPDTGYDGLSKVTVTTNVPSSGGETEEVTVDLSMADGNQVITPSAGKSISKATVTKPSTLIPANIKKDVVIGGVTGTLDSGGGGGADVSDFGDAAGNGCVIISPDKASISVYGKYGDNKPGGPDNNYAGYLRNELAPSQVGVSAALDAWAAELMTSGTAANNAFNAIFAGKEKAIFMGDPKRGLCNVPNFSSVTQKNFNGLLDALSAAFPANYKNEIAGMWWNYSLEDCAIFYNTYGTSYDASKMTYPFFWVAAKQVGFGVKYCSLQTPTDAPNDPDMAGAIVSINELLATDVNLNTVFPSAETGVTSVACCFADVLIYGGFVLYSHAAQTIPSNIAKSFIGLEQDTNLPQGWSFVSLTGSDFTPVAKTETEIQDIVMAGGHGIDPDIIQATSIQFTAQDFIDEETPQETAQAMATAYNSLIGYFHSYFKPVKDIIYEPVSMAKRFEMTFNLTEAQTT